MGKNKIPWLSLLALSLLVGISIGFYVSNTTIHARSTKTALSDHSEDSTRENVPEETEALETATESLTEDITEPEQEFEVFGAYDDRIFTREIPMEWEGDASGFTALPVQLDPEVQQFTWWLCKGYNLDFSLVMAMMWQESSFRPDVISKTNDYGLMQINACNHAWLSQTIGVTDFLDPYQNIRAGTFILRKLFEKYQDTSMVLMAYNMGEDGASRLWKQGIYSTNYSAAVLNYQWQITEMINNQKGGE